MVTPPPNPPSLRRSVAPSPPRAFTLIEILIVVMIIAIIGLVAVPLVGTQLHSSRLNTAANILAADIDFCQSESINNPNAPRQIQFTTNPSSYYLALTATPTTPILHPADSLPYLNDFSTGRNATLQGITISSLNLGPAGNTTLAFDAFGKPALTSDAVITLTDGSRTLTLTIQAATGDVTIQ